jgi:hypothetical protein
MSSRPVIRRTCLTIGVGSITTRGEPAASLTSTVSHWSDYGVTNSVPSGIESIG